VISATRTLWCCFGILKAGTIAWDTYKLVKIYDCQ